MEIFDSGKLATNFRNFPFTKLILWLVVIFPLVALTIKIGGWFLWVGMVISILLLYFGVGILLFRNCSPWRRVGIKGYSTWQNLLATRFAMRQHVQEWQGDGIYKDALVALLSRMYPSVSNEQIEMQSSKLIQQARGKQLVDRLKELCTRKGLSEQDAIRRATSISSSLQQNDRLGDGIVTYVLSFIIEKEFGVTQADRFWVAVGQGDIIQLRSPE